MTCPAVVRVTVPVGPAVVRVTAASGPAVVRVVTPGPPGPAGAAYVHQQAIASTTWTINHNLGYRPAVELLDSGSQEIDGEIAHPSVNQTIVTLNPATAGIARLT